MLPENELQLNNAFLFSFNPIPMGLSPFLGFGQSLKPNVLQNSKKQRAQIIGEEQGKGKWTKVEQSEYLVFLRANKE